jgi:hypothetical protein
MNIDRTKRLVIVAVVLLILGLAAPAICQISVGGLRCGSELVQKGDSMYLVKQRCGQPAETTVTGSVASGSYAGGRHSGGYQESISPTTVMIYDCGSSSYIYRLTFVGDSLTGLESIGRGSGPDSCR